MAVASPPTDASNAQLIGWSFEALNERNLSALRSLWTDETIERFPDRTCRGADEIAAYFEATFAALPDWHIDPFAIAGQDEHVFVQWHLTGTHRGPLVGIVATGKRIAIDGMDHFVVRDGKIVSNFVVADQMQYARQIGMMPADGSVLDKAMKAGFNALTTLTKQLRR